jgi:hypothetical protein
MEGVFRPFVPPFCLALGLATGFVIRDEIQMPAYMRIKMSTVEHHILTRRKLNTDLLSIIDQSQGKQQLVEQS